MLYVHWLNKAEIECFYLQQVVQMLNSTCIVPERPGSTTENAWQMVLVIWDALISAAYVSCK